MRKLSTLLIVTFLLLGNGVATAKPKYSLKNSDFKRTSAAWDKSVGGPLVSLYNGGGKKIATIAFYLAQPTQPTSGKTLGIKDLNSFSITILAKEPKGLSVGGTQLAEYLKTFSAELKNGGALNFMLTGNHDGIKTDFSIDVQATTSLKL